MGREGALVLRSVLFGCFSMADCLSWLARLVSCSWNWLTSKVSGRLRFLMRLLVRFDMVSRSSLNLALNMELTSSVTCSVVR